MIGYLQESTRNIFKSTRNEARTSAASVASNGLHRHVWRRLNCKIGVDGLYDMWKQDHPHGSILKLFFHTRERALAAALVLVACFVTFK